MVSESLLMLCTQSTAIFSDILRYIAHALLLTCENICNIIIAYEIGDIFKYSPTLRTCKKCMYVLLYLQILYHPNSIGPLLAEERKQRRS